MDEPIEDVYFNWLYSKVSVADVPTPSTSYWKLLRDLHSIEFLWQVLGDDNRAEDGLDVRREFLTMFNLDRNTAWANLGCSVLEMLIAFARKAEFETDRDYRYWFWLFIENLGLLEFTDARHGFSQRVVNIIDRFIWRTYRWTGEGGMFPLRNPEQDQRKVEIWYQFCEYLIDQELLQL